MLLKRCTRNQGARLATTVIFAGVVAALMLLGWAEAANQLSGNTVIQIKGGDEGTTEVSALGRYLAGRAARRDGDTASAADFLGYALAGDPANEGLQLEAFAVLIADGRIDAALELATAIHDREPHMSLGNVVLAVTAARSGDFNAAQQQARKASKRSINRLVMPLVTALAPVGSKNFEGAIKSLKVLGKRKAFANFQRYHEALVNDLAGKNEAAETAYRALVDHEAVGSQRWYQAYGNFLERNGRGGEAISLYKRALSRDPDAPVLAQRLSAAEKGTVPNRFVADARSGLAEALFGVASVLSQEGALETAMIYARLAIFLRGEYPVAQLLVGRILETHEHWQEAITTYRDIDAESDYAWDAQLRTAASLQRLKHYDEAIKLLRVMVKMAPVRTDALVALGDLYRSRKNWSEAVEQYDQAMARVLEHGNANWTLLYARGIALERAKRWDRAEDDFLRALELRPDQPLVLNYLGYSWIEQGRHLERARKMIEKAVRLRPRDGYIVDSLGWVLYRLGDFEGAVKQLERAVELRPQDPVINDHLGDSYWRVGRTLEARFQWQRALAFEPEETLVLTIERKLGKGLED